MRIVKLDAIDSTNAYLKRTMRTKAVEDYTVVLAKEQLSGRGQAGSSWASESGKNLTFSILKKFEHFHTEHHFYLNVIASLSIYKTLKNLQVPNLSIKWPNDILSGNCKICGILIETTLAGNLIKNAIIGVGLNVNQTNFPNLPQASSLKSLLRKSLNHDELLQMLLVDLKQGFLSTKDFDQESLRKNYDSKLFMRDRPASFILPEGSRATGIIKGISPTGKLRVAFEEEGLKEFDLKGIKLLY